ncbi:hypothetical protein [Paracandidimonas lactea]|uniref:hypothetical protein n=1 Tax=Paracandidimonas lactea TaxID=2895524 RepID=UPI001F490C3C|nr:hypothetical protein [Paracandidimonas lactea]
MSTITLTRGGKQISASEQAARVLQREGWVIQKEQTPVTPPAMVAVTASKPKRKARK